jgi:hypothetical protein
VRFLDHVAATADRLADIPDGTSDYSDVRREFALRAQDERGPVEVVHIIVGPFMAEALYGFFPAFDLPNGEAHLWGDGHEKMQFTTAADAAIYAAEAALDDRPLPDRLYVAGDSLTFHELVDATAAGLGRPITVNRHGSLADLQAEIDRHAMQMSPTKCPGCRTPTGRRCSAATRRWALS